MSNESERDPMALGRPIGETATTATSGQDLEPQTSSPIDHTSSTIPQTSSGPSPPQLHHTRTAPTTFPIHPVAHQGFAAHHTGAGLPAIHDHEDDGDALGPIRDGTHVPLEAGGLHGMPMPGSRARAVGETGTMEKDRQAGSMGYTPRIGQQAAKNPLIEKAAHELGLDTLTHAHANGSSGPRTKTRSNTLDEKSISTSTPPPAFTSIGRTATGTQIHRNVKTGGRDTVQGYGMMPIVRQASLPPAVGPFGGTAPTGVDAEEGLWAVRSHEEELERQKTMDKKGPDPFAVRFVPGDKENPKVSTHRGS